MSLKQLQELISGTYTRNQVKRKKLPKLCKDKTNNDVEHSISTLQDSTMYQLLQSLKQRSKGRSSVTPKTTLPRSMSDEDILIDILSEETLADAIAEQVLQMVLLKNSKLRRIMF